MKMRLEPAFTALSRRIFYALIFQQSYLTDNPEHIYPRLPLFFQEQNKYKAAVAPK